MTVIASGLGATLGVVQEETPGDAATVTRWIPFLKDNVKGEKYVVESQALYGGLVPLASHRSVVGYDSKGTYSFEITDRQMGIFWQNMLGSTPTYATTTGVTTQTHNLGNPTGMSFSAQSGRPTTAGVEEPFTYAGCKIVDWEIACATKQIAKLNLTIDAMGRELTSTSYAAPSLVAANTFNFAGGNLLIGGSTPVGVVKDVSLKGAWGLDVERFQIGSLTKNEQLVNDWLKLSCAATIEFANLTNVWNAFNADTQVTFELTFTGPVVSGSTPSSMTITFAAAYADAGPPDIEGPAIVTQKTNWVGLNPSSGYAVVITYTGLDSTA